MGIRRTPNIFVGMQDLKFMIIIIFKNCVSENKQLKCPWSFAELKSLAVIGRTLKMIFLERKRVATAEACQNQLRVGKYHNGSLPYPKTDG